MKRTCSINSINSVGVIGAGTMGAGIAYSCLSAGLTVVLLDSNGEGLERFSVSQDYDALADVDLVIEAVFENMAIKKAVFDKLDQACKRGAILATNTSTLDVDEIAASTDRPRDVIGLHFFSPAHIMRLLEIVRGAKTSDDVIATSLALAKRLRKIGVVVGNCNGFVGNRMLHGYGRENQLLLLEGATPEFVDGVLQEWGMAMGPSAVGDLAGLDVGYKARRERRDLPDDPRYYRVADVLVEMGRLGQKTGKGMYLYEPGSRTPVPDPEVLRIIRDEAKKLGVEQREIGKQEVIERCIYALVVEGARILEDGIASRPEDIDVIWLNGYGFPRHRGGPMHYADTVGLDTVHVTVCDFNERFGGQYWDPPELLATLAKEGRRFADLAQ